MSGIIKNKESLTTKLTLIIVGLTAASGLLVPATYASFHPVTTGEIADNTILSVDIGNGQVRTEDIGAGQVRTGDIADNAIVPNIQRIVGNNIEIRPNTFTSTTATCPEGTVITGGGFGKGPFLDVQSNRPITEDTWIVSAHNRGTSNTFFQAYALCMGPMP